MSYYADDTVTVWHGDCLEVLATLPDASVDAVVTDPPYALNFMGKDWDRFSGYVERNGSSRAVGDDGGRHDEGYRNMRGREREFQAWCELWATECLRVLKPGGHLLAFGGTRTSHRLTCAIEDAGFEIRDSIAWLYGQGFAKSLNLDNLKQSPFCRCQVRELASDDPLRPLRDRGASGAEQGEATGAGVLHVQLPVEDGQRPRAGAEAIRLDGEGSPRQVRISEPSVEGRRDTQAGEGQLHGGQVHPLSGGVPGDGTSGRLHHGAPAGDGSMARPLSAADGSGQPQGPQPVEQPPRESGAVPVERGPQAWGGWPVCERCSQPVIPAGLGTALKPAHEPVVVARKPLSGTVAQTVLEHGTGALNVDGCRVGTAETLGRTNHTTSRFIDSANGSRDPHPRTVTVDNSGGLGRWPANVVLDESQAAALDQQSGERPSSGGAAFGKVGYDGGWTPPSDGTREIGFGDTGGASRFFYTAKADAAERVRIDGTAHPTVKPLALMRWLVRLVCPSGGLVLEPFAGSGTTVEACILEGFRCVAIEREADYLPLILQRIHRRRDPVAAVKATGVDGGLFDLLGEEPAS